MGDHMIWVPCEVRVLKIDDERQIEYGRHGKPLVPFGVDMSGRVWRNEITKQTCFEVSVTLVFEGFSQHLVYPPADLIGRTMA